MGGREETGSRGDLSADVTHGRSHSTAFTLFSSNNALLSSQHAAACVSMVETEAKRQQLAQRGHMLDAHWVESKACSVRSVIRHPLKTYRRIWPSPSSLSKSPLTVVASPLSSCPPPLKSYCSLLRKQTHPPSGYIFM